VLRYEAHGKFGEHLRGVRVAQGTGESCNSSLLNALQTIPYASYLDLHSGRMNHLFYIIMNAINAPVDLKFYAIVARSKQYASMPT